MENEWLQRHLNLSICGILSPRRPPLSFSFLISAPISNLANSLPPIFAWFYLNKLHLASPSWLFQSRLKPASAIQPALRAFSCRVGTHPPEPLSPHLDDPAPRWTISTPPPPSNLFNSSYSHHASHHTHNPMVGRSPSIRALFFVSRFQNASALQKYSQVWPDPLDPGTDTTPNSGRRSQRGNLLCTPECISIFCKSWATFYFGQFRLPTLLDDANFTNNLLY